MTTNFEVALEHITADGTLKISVLYGFSMMTAQNLSAFATVWPTISPLKRLKIIRNLVELTEENFDLNFDPIFLLALNDSEAGVQTEAIQGLWENESPTLIPLFIHLLKEGQTPSVRAAAAKALGRFVYLGEIEEIDETGRFMAGQALLKAIKKPAEDIEVVRRAIESIAFSGQDGIEDIIENAYYHENEQMRISALFAMGRNYNKRWGKFVVAELDNHNPEFRFEAARTCGELELKPAVGRLIQLIAEEVDTEVQLNAIWALGQIGGATARKVLEDITLLPDPIFNQAAEDALNELLVMSGQFNDLLAFNDEAVLAEDALDTDRFFDADDDDTSYLN